MSSSVRETHAHHHLRHQELRHHEEGARLPPQAKRRLRLSQLNRGHRVGNGQVVRRRFSKKPAQVPTMTATMRNHSMKKSKSAATKAKEGASPSRLIDARIRGLNDWRGEMLARVRSLIKESCPDVVEEWKWLGVPVWEHAGIICTGETYKAVVKLTFARGAALADPSHLFNASLEGNVRRAIDIREGDKINGTALKALVRAAVALNASKQKPKRA